jgi:hypothetical protein
VVMMGKVISPRRLPPEDDPMLKNFKLVKNANERLQFQLAARKDSNPLYHNHLSSSILSNDQV